MSGKCLNDISYEHGCEISQQNASKPNPTVVGNIEYYDQEWFISCTQDCINIQNLIQSIILIGKEWKKNHDYVNKLRKSI